MKSLVFKRKQAKNGGYWGTIVDEDDKCVLTMAAKGKWVAYSKDDIENLFKDLITCIEDKSYAWRDE